MTDVSAPDTMLHGTCLALDGAGVLLRGPSGSGKSDLAYRLIANGGGHAALVADDQVIVKAAGGKLWANAPPALSGKLELRGLGLISLPALEVAPVVLIVDLVPREDVPRLPDPTFQTVAGIEIASLRLHAFDTTSPDKVRLAAKSIPHRGFPGEDGLIDPGD